MDSFSFKLASYTSRLNASDMSHKAAMCILDWLAGAIYASDMPLASRYLDTLNGCNVQIGARVPGRKESYSLYDAAWLSGAYGHLNETDDGHRYSVTHPGSVVIPAVVSYCSVYDVDVDTALSAVVAGYEACIRVGMSFGVEHYDRFHTTATAGTFGAAAAVSRLIGLSPLETSHAFGHAGTQCAGVWQFLKDGAAEAKSLHTANASRNGTMAAILASNGIEAAREIFEGEAGLFSFMSTEPQPDMLTPLPNSPLKIEETNFKLYPTCGQTHSAIDATSTLLDRITSPEDIDKITLHIYKKAIDIAGIDKPQNLQEGKFSNQFCVAFMLANSTEIRFDNMTEGDLLDEAVQKIMKKITIIEDEEFTATFPRSRPCRLSITMKNGDKLEAFNEYRKGDPEKPVGWDELRCKFSQLLRCEARVEKIVSWAKNLPRSSGKMIFPEEIFDKKS